MLNGKTKVKTKKTIKTKKKNKISEQKDQL
jgi:hypothetical protein